MTYEVILVPSAAFDPDLHLLEAWRAGDLEAGATLFERYYPDVRRFFTNKIAELGDREDLIQATFLGCLESIARFRGEASFRTLLFAIARNKLLKHLRTRGREQRLFGPTPTTLAADSPCAAAMFAASGDRDRLIAALRRLPLATQRMLELFYWQALPIKAIATLLELSANTVKTQMRRGRAQLEKQLARSGWTQPLDRRAKARPAVNSLLVVACLLVARPAWAQASVEAPASGASETSEAQPGDPASASSSALSRLEEALRSANSSVDPEVLAELADAIATLDPFVEQLSQSKVSRDAMIQARLSLARGYTKTDPALADAVLDELLRRSVGASSEIPIENFGGSMNARFKAREAAMADAPRATLRVVCWTACELTINSQPVSAGEHALLLGRHVVWYRSLEGGVPSTTINVDLDSVGLEIVVGANPKPPDSEPEDPHVEPVEPAKAPAPPLLLPRGELDTPRAGPQWPQKLAVGGLVLGSGLIVGGATMLVFDGRCTNGSAVLDTCPKIVHSVVGGALALGFGTALMITAFVLDRHAPSQRPSPRVSVAPNGLHF